MAGLERTSRPVKTPCQPEPRGFVPMAPQSGRGFKKKQTEILTRGRRFNLFDPGYSVRAGPVDFRTLSATGTRVLLPARLEPERSCSAIWPAASPSLLR